MNRLRVRRAAVLTVLGMGLVQACGSQTPPQTPPPPAEEAPAELVFEQGGETYAIVNGDAFQVKRNGKRKFLEHLYDPDFAAKNYKSVDGEVFQRDPESAQLYAVTRHFREDFEEAASTEDLFRPSRWHANNVDPRRAGKQHNYYDLGNRVTLSRDVVHGGGAALRCQAVPSSKSVSKASISKNIMYFRKGDDVYFSAWFFIEDTPDLYDAGGFTLFDLESSFFSGVGLRVIFRTNDSLAFELELPKTQFKQERGSEVRFPTGQWVHVKAHAFLSDVAGFVRIWQDGSLVLDQSGRTLPLADTVYDRFEIGISAIAQGSRYEKVLYVDDIVISDSPIID